MQIIDEQGFLRPIALVYNSQAAIAGVRNCGIALGEVRMRLSGWSRMCPRAAI